MNRLRRVLLALLIVALALPVFTASAENLSAEQKFEVLRDKGIFTGFDDGSARLQEAMSREQFAAVLFRLWQLKEERPAKASFYDVLKTRWSYEEIEAVRKAGLMQGVGGGKFAPQTAVTVEQLAAILVRAYGYNDASSTRVQGKVSAWARGAVAIALDRQIISVRDNYTVNATRALLVEAAYAVYQQMNFEKISVKSVQPTSNNVIQVVLNQAIKSADPVRFSVKDDQGRAVVIRQVSLSTDGKTIWVTTDRQNAYVSHKLYIDGDSWRYSALPEDSTKPQLVSFSALPNRVLQLVFSEPVESGSATDARHYGFIGDGLQLSNIKLSEDRKTVTMTTSRQRDGYTYRFVVQEVRDLAGNTMDTRNDLYFNGVDDNVKPTVQSVTGVNPSAIRIVFSEKVNVQQATDIRNYSLNNGLYVQRAAIDNDGRTVTLWTNEQRDGQNYKITIRDIADLAGNVMNTRSNIDFTGMNDQTKPTVKSVKGNGDGTVSVVFSEKVNPQEAANTGNYSVDHGLGITRAVLASDGLTVTLTTTKQQDATLYNLTVSGISDLAGNRMDRQTDLLFGGVVDRTPPTVAKVTASTNQVVLAFSERLDRDSASDARNYQFDGGLGLPIAVSYDDGNRTVTLTTGTQVSGNAYSLTINNVKDLSGLAIAANTRVSFSGNGEGPGSGIALQSLTVVDQNTVLVAFSRRLFDDDVADLDLRVVSEDGRSVSNGDWRAFVQRKPGADNAVTVQYRTASNANPSLFQAGHVYEGRATGIRGLNTANDANRKPFAGTENANPVPFATQAAAQNRKAVKITFSEPVRGISASAFRILRDDGSAVDIASESVQDSRKVVTEVTLNLKEELKGDQTYRVQFRDSVTDAAGWNKIKTEEDSKPYTLTFRGVD
ncbi:Ig-like domain-containing protein [Cohnella nanjingensis]|uniref:Ig-like domain-containing protein n=1 Tax=Cohnella nanjingensis TaxID=1387779 RepID=A0A7X0VIV6_9BACL|nr:Ig-like domain-containing protein [Cohnella nanjingensis]MBB6675341.1 Ig-like domain-containing protein [Cohnella nanjingensis]